MTTAAELRKGWCPGALRPMPAKDGLLVRLRVTAGRLAAETLRALADAGQDHGNGLFDLTSRGNLQMRGVAESDLPRLLATLRGLGLADATIAGEAVRNVLVSPLTGLETCDLGALAAALERALVAEARLHALPGKFAFAIDDGSAPSLGAIAADVRFVRQTGDSFAIGLGGNDAQAAFVGACPTRDIVPTALRLARAFLELREALQETHQETLPEPPRRMRDLLHRIVEPERITAAAGLSYEPRSAPTPITPADPRPVGLIHLGNGASCFGIGAAFGRLDTAMLKDVAEVAKRFGTGEVRLTPWRALLLPGIASVEDIHLGSFGSGGGLVTDPGDSRLGLAACPGATGCERATTEPRRDASELAHLVHRLGMRGIALHVSGCAKGCARRERTPVVLIGRESRYDFVLNGTADSIPLAQGLDLAAAGALLEEVVRKGLVNS
jgi:precorrin-3B synthase